MSLYCVARVSCEASAQVTSLRFDSYQKMKATLRASKKNMLIDRILLWPGHTLLYWVVNCARPSHLLPAQYFSCVHIFYNIFINSEIQRVRSNRRPPPWPVMQWDFRHYQWYYFWQFWWRLQDTWCNSIKSVISAIKCNNTRKFIQKIISHQPKVQTFSDFGASPIFRGTKSDKCQSRAQELNS